MEAVAQKIRQRAVLRRRAARKGLGWQKAAKLVLRVLPGVGSGNLRRAVCAGRYVAEAKAVCTGCAVDAGVIIIFGSTSIELSVTEPGVTMRMMSRFTSPFASAGSSICSQMATL